MRSSFYIAAAGAEGHQAKMGVIANNMANSNTHGYKSKNAVFSDLVYTAMEADGVERGQKGHSIRLQKTESTLRQSGGLSQTGREHDFGIEGDGFFALLNPSTEEILYTRDGRFDMSNLDGVFYLTDPYGRQVLDQDGSPIELLAEGAAQKDLRASIGIYKIPIGDGLVSDGLNAYRATEKNGEIVVQEGASEDGRLSTVHQGVLELSNVQLPKEMAQIIETQRAFQMALKMVQTADELEQLENELRR